MSPDILGESTPLFKSGESSWGTDLLGISLWARMVWGRLPCQWAGCGQHRAVSCWGDPLRLLCICVISLSNLDLFLLFLLEAKHFSPLLLSSTEGAGPYLSQLFLTLSTQKLSQKASMLVRIRYYWFQYPVGQWFRLPFSPGKSARGWFSADWGSFAFHSRLHLTFTESHLCASISLAMGILHSTRPMESSSSWQDRRGRYLKNCRKLHRNCLMIVLLRAVRGK